MKSGNIFKYITKFHKKKIIKKMYNFPKKFHTNNTMINMINEKATRFLA